MPSATKTTFSLDSGKVVRQADAQVVQMAGERIAALHALQKSLKDRGVDFDAWKKAIKDGRR